MKKGGCFDLLAGQVIVGAQINNKVSAQTHMI
jgi:hypothetical protein